MVADEYAEGDSGQSIATSLVRRQEDLGSMATLILELWTGLVINCDTYPGVKRARLW